MAAKLRVTLRKSPIGYTARTHGTLRALGLRRIGQSRELPDDPATRGQLQAVRFLVEVEEIAPPDRRGKTRPAPEHVTARDATPPEMEKAP